MMLHHNKLFSLLLCVVGISSWISSSNGHGMMTIPPARNWLDWINNNYYWPDGNNGGGYKVVSENGQRRWPDGARSLCGDDVHTGKQPYMQPGPVVATFKEGQTIEIHVLITTNHYGRFEFRLCPASATQDSDCQKLQRADGRGEAWDLPLLAEGSRFNGGALGENLRPMAFDNFYSWYQQPWIKCASTAHCGRFEGMPVYKLRYNLPKGYKCDKCILQWHYLTGHKCHPPCLNTDKYYPDCRSNPKFKGTYLATMDYCGMEWSAHPEEFWNCADIKIQ